MKWDIPGCQWNNPNQTLFWYYALKFCKAPMKFDTKMALFDISVPSLPDLLTHVNREICQTLSIKLIWLSSWENTLQCRLKYFLNYFGKHSHQTFLGIKCQNGDLQNRECPLLDKSSTCKILVHRRKNLFDWKFSIGIQVCPISCATSKSKS